MGKTPKLILLEYPENDVYLERLKAVEDMLLNLPYGIATRETELALANLQNSIFWYMTAFPEDKE